MPYSMWSFPSLLRQKRLQPVIHTLITLLSLVCLSSFYVIYSLLHDRSATSLRIFSSQAVTAQQLLDAYHPIDNAAELETRLNQTCHVKLPNNEQLAHFRKLYPALSRFIMYYNVHLLLENHTQHVLPSQPLQALQLGGSFAVFQNFQDKLNISETQYPLVDIHRTHLPSNSYDIIGADQVIEHVLFPHLAIMEIHRLLRPNGIAILTTCAYNPVHGKNSFSDFWRFMRDGLMVLSLPFRGGVMQCGTWGTSKMVSTRAKYHYNSSHENKLFEQMFDSEVRVNDLDNPFQSWIVMRK